MSKPMLIGLTGRAGAGKDSVAAIMAKHGYQRYSMAGPLKRGIEAMFNLPPSIWDDRVAKEAAIPWLGRSPRYLAQTLGTEWGRDMVAKDLWLKLMEQRWEEIRVGPNPRMVITDVRFNDEAERIIDSNGLVFRVLREGVAAVEGHVSEQGIHPKWITADIKNYGTLEDLEVTVSALLSRVVKA